MRAWALAIGLITTTVLSGCRLDDGKLEAEIADMKAKVVEQQQIIATLKTASDSSIQEIESLKKRVKDGELKDMMAALEKTRTAVLSVTEKSYSAVRTDLGDLLFVVDNVVPYANGVKMNIRIGNLTSATFNGVKLKVSWGKDVFTTTQKEISLVGSLLPGAWNNREIILSPANVAELGFVEVEPKLDQLQLRPAP